MVDLRKETICPLFELVEPLLPATEKTLVGSLCSGGSNLRWPLKRPAASAQAQKHFNLQVSALQA